MINKQTKKKAAIIVLLGCLCTPLFSQVEELKVYKQKKPD